MIWLAFEASKQRHERNTGAENTRVMPVSMKQLSKISDAELLSLMQALVLAERGSTADVIEHLMEIDRRKLYANQACGSLSSYCIERLFYSEDEAGKRVRVARLAKQFPELLDELRSGAMHLTGLCLLAPYLTVENCESLVAEARHKSKRGIEELIARRFPKPSVADQICPVPEQVTVPALVQSEISRAPKTEAGPTIRPGTDRAAEQLGLLKPLSASSWSVQFTASAAFREKIERARELVSHALPNGDLASLFERGLDELIEKETKRRLGAAKPRKARRVSAGSRHIPVEIARIVWERDDGQCTFIDEQGRRCSARRFVQIEHRHPHALGGPPTAENLCLLCAAHNAQAARNVFGAAYIEAQIEAKRAEREAKARAEVEVSECYEKVHSGLRKLGFGEKEVRFALAELRRSGLSIEPGRDRKQSLKQLLLAALRLLGPPPSCSRL